MRKLEQRKTPLFDALKNYIDAKVIPFHVPGHKQGHGLQELRNYVGERILEMDVNGMEDLDYANNPTGVIKEAETLFAHAYNSQDAFFLVNGTTAGVQAMIMSVCGPGDKIIVPRNAHKSTIGGIILSGAIPVYIYPEINDNLGISVGVTIESVKQAIKEHPHAKAIFSINPTYYGTVSDLKTIITLAHKHNMAVLVDEAHGAHMPFHTEFPPSAMSLGADMSAASIHKTAGSLTQSSVLFLKSNIVTPQRVRQVLNLTTTSSASYLLMCSLDIARKQLALHGHEMLQETLSLARWARSEINQINGLYAFGKELIGTPGCHAFDETKLGINVSQIGITGYQLESILRKEYNIQIEMADYHNVLLIISIGDRKQDVQALVAAMRDIAARAGTTKIIKSIPVPRNPEMIISPRDAFYSPKKTVLLDDSVGEIAAEMVMAYPPGIPVICLGERITKEIVEYIKILKAEKCQLQGTSDPYVEHIKVLGRG